MMTRWLLSANDMDPRRKSTVQYQVKVLEVTKICRSAIKCETDGCQIFKKKQFYFPRIFYKKNSIFVVDEGKLLLSSLHTSSKRLLSSHLTTIQHNLRDQHSQGNLEQSHLSNARNWSYFFLGNFPSLFWAWWWTVLMFHCLKFQKESHFQGKSSHS